MLAYPIQFEPDDDTILVTSPDFPELTTFGDDRDEAVAHAVDALEEAIAARIHDGEDLPQPSAGADYATLPALTEAKVLLYQGMQEHGIGKEELAYKLGSPTSLVDGVLDIQNSSDVRLMDAALRTVGRRLTVTTLTD